MFGAPGRSAFAVPARRLWWSARPTTTVPSGPGRPLLKKRIKEMAQTRVRCDYWRIEALLRRDGRLVIRKRVRRLYNELGLQLRSKLPKRRVKAKLRADRTTATAANQIRTMDFVHDLLFEGRKIRILTIVDILSRYVRAIDARSSYRGAGVVETLERIAHEAGCPQTFRLDNGPEFISKELDQWAFLRGVTLDFSQPGKPTDNAYIESLNGKFRVECLNANWFTSLVEARRKCEAWRRDYNELPPHSTLGQKVPKELYPTRGLLGQPGSG